jgi:hypothetical protein
MTGMDSGVIDLFAIHKQASEAPPAPSPLASAPPPAFTTDLLSAPKSGPDLGLDDDENPFAEQGNKKKPVYFALAGAGALLVIGIAIAAFSGGSEPAKPAAAAQKPAVTAEATPPPPPPAHTAEPAPPATTTPAAPSTGAVATSPKAPAFHGGGARKAAAPKKSSGPKLEKVQSTGVPPKS